jgi:hypothetical protein
MPATLIVDTTQDADLDVQAQQTTRVRTGIMECTALLRRRYAIRQSPSCRFWFQ